MANKRATDLMAEINAQFKSEVLNSANSKQYMVEYLPTGVLPIDLLLRGGLPRNRFTEIYGDFSSLKSWVGLKAIATSQASGNVCALIDTEHSFDPAWAVSCGVDLEALILQQPESGELAMDTTEALIRGKVDLIVFDSIASALPQAERNKRLHDENVQPARLAQLMSVACRKLTAANANTSMLWINQMRTNVGVTFGNPAVVTGGKSMAYYAAYRLNSKKKQKITRDVKAWDGTEYKTVKEQVGQKITVTVEKSKLSRPHREINFIWDYIAAGIDELDFLVAYGVEEGYVSNHGNTFEYDGIKSVGRTNFKKKLAVTPDSLSKLRGQAEQSIVDVVPPVSVTPPKKKKVTRRKKVQS